MNRRFENTKQQLIAGESIALSMSRNANHIAPNVYQKRSEIPALVSNESSYSIDLSHQTKLNCGVQGPRQLIA